MGLYVNPTDCTKREWLARNATRCSRAEALLHDYTSNSLRVFYVDNGPFDAIAIGFNKTETLRFLSGRPDAVCYIVTKEVLKPYL